MRIAVPISGVQIFDVDTTDKEKAFDLILSGEAEPIDDGAVDIDQDTNNWEVKDKVSLSWDEAGRRDYLKILLGGQLGIHLPKAFINGFTGWSCISDENANILRSGPTAIGYGYAWVEVLDIARFTDVDDNTWRLYQHGGLFMIRDDVDIDWGSV